MSKIELDVSGMTCGHCQSAVAKALRSVPGVQGVEVNLGAGRAVVEGSADAQALVSAVAGEGYGARVANS